MSDAVTRKLSTSKTSAFWLHITEYVTQIVELAVSYDSDGAHTPAEEFRPRSSGGVSSACPTRVQSARSVELYSRMPGSQPNVEVASTYSSPIRIIDGSGAKPATTGFAIVVSELMRLVLPLKKNGVDAIRVHPVTDTGCGASAPRERG